MDGATAVEERPTGSSRMPGLVPWLLALGLFLTFKGYHSLEGDQAHRLPLLLHGLDSGVYADDPFVRAFDAFNPHRGALAVLSVCTRLIGLPAALALLFAVSFFLSVWGIHRLAKLVWPQQGEAVGWIAVGIFLTAKAGNIGTNHLFEAMLLDRLLALGLAWVGGAAIIESPRDGWWRSALALGGATWLHPSLGLQLALVFSGAWFAWAMLGERSATSWKLALVAVAASGLAIVPGLIENLAPFGNLREGLTPETFRLITVELQSPQHMSPHLWRRPQWLAAGAYLLLTAVAWLARRRDAAIVGDSARLRFLLLLGASLVWLGCSWVAVEMLEHLGATIFQPFRIATLARGLCLIAASGRIAMLWRRSQPGDRLRASILALGFTGDLLFVAVVLIETVMTLLERLDDRLGDWARGTVLALVLGWGLVFLNRHDTDDGATTLAVAAVVGTVAGLAGRSARGVSFGDANRRLRWATAAAWALPCAALIAGATSDREPEKRSKLAQALISRCRFLPTPVNDIEGLAVWCRENTPTSSRFIGPPGPKGFRLWSRRDWAFNRAGSPYHAEGLRDWYERFRDHVDFDGPPEALVRAYLDGRHRLEARYEAMTDDGLARLALRQGADYVVARSDRPAATTGGGPLERLQTRGEFAVYRVCTERVAQVQR